MLRTTKELLDQGWNLEKVSNKQFNTIFTEWLQQISLQELGKRRETGRKWEPNPELEELGLKLADRMKKIVMEQVKKLDKEIDSYKESIHKARQKKKEGVKS